MEDKIDNLLKELVGLKSTVASKEDIQQIQKRLGAVEYAQMAQSTTQIDIQRRSSKLSLPTQEGPDR